jgi:hypothetical protein
MTATVEASNFCFKLLIARNPNRWERHIHARLITPSGDGPVTSVPRTRRTFIVSQAEVRLVADETSSATAAKIKSDQDQIEAAQEIEAPEAKYRKS